MLYYLRVISYHVSSSFYRGIRTLWSKSITTTTTTAAPLHPIVFHLHLIKNTKIPPNYYLLLCDKIDETSRQWLSASTNNTTAARTNMQSFSSEIVFPPEKSKYDNLHPKKRKKLLSQYVVFVGFLMQWQTNTFNLLHNHVRIFGMELEMCNHNCLLTHSMDKRKACASFWSK